MASNKRFSIGQRQDPMQFMTWFINSLHEGILEKRAISKYETKKDDILSKIAVNSMMEFKTIITSCFQGELFMKTKKL